MILMISVAGGDHEDFAERAHPVLGLILRACATLVECFKLVE